MFRRALTPEELKELKEEQLRYEFERKKKKDKEIQQLQHQAVFHPKPVKKVLYNPGGMMGLFLNSMKLKKK